MKELKDKAREWHGERLNIPFVGKTGTGRATLANGLFGSSRSGDTSRNGVQIRLDIPDVKRV